MGARCSIAPGTSLCSKPALPILKPTRKRTVFEKVRWALLGAVEQLQLFSAFTEALYPSPEEAYQALLGSTPAPLSRRQFVVRSKQIGFTGKAEWVFETVQDGQGFVQCETFTSRMTQARSMKQNSNVIAIVKKMVKVAKDLKAKQEAEHIRDAFKKNAKANQLPPRAPASSSSATLGASSPNEHLQRRKLRSSSLGSQVSAPEYKDIAPCANRSVSRMESKLEVDFSTISTRASSRTSSPTPYGSQEESLSPSPPVSTGRRPSVRFLGDVDSSKEKQLGSKKWIDF